MAAPVNTLLTTGGSAVVGMREDLSPVVSQINPADTPFYMWAGKSEATNSIAHQWSTVTLRAPAKNARAEGDVYAASAPKRSTKLTNACQIHDDVAEVSNTAGAVEVAGDLGSLEEQELLKAMEVRRDLEYTLLSNQVIKVSDPREMAGLQTWSGNAKVGVGGTLPTGDGTTALAHGTERNIGIDILNDLFKTGWTLGARYGMALSGSGQKLAFDAIVPGEQQLADPQVVVRNDEGVPLITTVSVWRSAFGAVKWVMDPVMDEPTLDLDRLVFFMDEREEYKPKVCPLPGLDWYREPLAKVARTEREAIGWEGTLEVPNPIAVAILAGLSDAYSS